MPLTRQEINKRIVREGIHNDEFNHRVHQHYCKCGRVRHPNRGMQYKHGIGLCSDCMRDPDIYPKCKAKTVKGKNCRGIGLIGFDEKTNTGWCAAHKKQMP